MLTRRKFFTILAGMACVHPSRRLNVEDWSNSMERSFLRRRPANRMKERHTAHRAAERRRIAVMNSRFKRDSYCWLDGLEIVEASVGRELPTRADLDTALTVISYSGPREPSVYSAPYISGSRVIELEDHMRLPCRAVFVGMKLQFTSPLGSRMVGSDLGIEIYSSPTGSPVISSYYVMRITSGKQPLTMYFLNSGVADGISRGLHCTYTNSPTGTWTPQVGVACWSQADNTANLQMLGTPLTRSSHDFLRLIHAARREFYDV
jgi:hypothetical protein